MGVRAMAGAEVTDPTHGAHLSASVRRPGRGWTLVMGRVGPQSMERKFAVREKKNRLEGEKISHKRKNNKLRI